MTEESKSEPKKEEANEAQSASNIIELAQSTAKRLEIANQEAKNIIARQNEETKILIKKHEEIMAKALMGIGDGAKKQEDMIDERVKKTVGKYFR